MPEYGLGFDTGGTYTDAVIMDFTTGEVVCSAKSLTTRYDLSVGIAGSLEGFDQEMLRHVRMVSLSSTLATNSIVEGKGCRVALVSIGREYDRSVPVDQYIRVAGGHTLTGTEAEELDEVAVVNFLESVKGNVDGVAVTGYLSVRNPDHENRVMRLARSILDVPVVCGHQLSSSLGFNERTVTCIMNARLMPIIRELMDSVKRVMAAKGIEAPLMIVKGDGSVMGEAVALERPIETILSGPAASMIGAKYLTGLNDAIVMDIGGTTTDIGILRDGSPRLEKEGAVIGGRRTRVLAAEIATSGIGGDSRIVINGGELYLSSLRVVPVCIAASEYPCLMDKLRAVAEAPPMFMPQCVDRRKITQEIEFFVKIKDVANAVLTDADRALLECVSEEPRSLSEAGKLLNIHPFSFDVSRMEELGMIQRIGLTPTDLLHAERSYVQYSAEASDLAVKHMAARMKMSSEKFVATAKQKVVEKIASELLKKLFFEETGEFEPTGIGLDLMTKAITGREGMDYSCAIRVNKPIIGIGAPVAAYLPKVAEMFGTELHLSEYSGVGNAVGAVTGSVVETVEILIKPDKGAGGFDDPPCTLFASFGKQAFPSYSEAMRFAEEKGVEVASDNVLAAGAESFEVKTEVKEKRFSVDEDVYGDSSVLLEAQIVITAVGKPRQFVHRERSSYYTDLSRSWDV